MVDDLQDALAESGKLSRLIADSGKNRNLTIGDFYNINRLGEE